MYGLNLNEIVQIPCEVEAIPDQVTFQWRFERNLALANFVPVNASRSVLEYYPQSREHYGLIECTAKNEIGIQREPCRYLIVPAAGPYFPYSCGVANQSDSSVSIRCDGTVLTNNNATDMEQPKQAEEETRTRLASSKKDNDDNDDDDDDDDDDERDDADEPLLRSKAKANQRRPPDSPVWSNLTTSDIYALYFAPDDDGSSSDRLSYRSEGTAGGLLPMANSGPSGALELSRLESSASLLLNELVARFNSHPLADRPHLFVYPPTNYICEIYAIAPRPMLIKNVTMDAVGRRIMNPFNGSFSFLVDDLPANTPIRVNIYARNNRKRSPLSIELDTRTLPGVGGGGNGGHGHDDDGRMSSMSDKQSDGEGGGGRVNIQSSEGNAKGRKSAAGNFLEELYGGYGRFRSKHLVVGLIIGTVAITIFVAVLLIVIATIRSKEPSSNGTVRRRCSSSSSSANGNNIELESRAGLTLRNGKNGLATDKTSPNGTLKRKLKSSSTKETTFTGNAEDDDDVTKSAAAMTATTLDALAGNGLTSGGGDGDGCTVGNVVAIGTTGYAGLDGDDDNSMRSDHQLISQGSSYHQHPLHHQLHSANAKQAPTFYQTLVSGYKARPTTTATTTTGGVGQLPPPSYYDLDTAALATSGAYLNLYTTAPTAADVIKPDLLQHAPVFEQGGGEMFNAMSFATAAAGGGGLSGQELLDQGAMLMASDQLSGKCFYLWSRGSELVSIFSKSCLVIYASVCACSVPLGAVIRSRGVYI